MEWMTAMLIGQVCSFSAQLERQAIARRTRASPARARAEDKRLGRPPSLDEDQMTAIHQDLAENMTVVAISRQYGIPIVSRAETGNRRVSNNAMNQLLDSLDLSPSRKPRP
jgi:DNA invertase Pin-like site-specific DNA recombinase